MHSKLNYIFLFCILFLFSCGKNEFSLNFDLKEDITENYNVTYYATDIDGGLTVQAVASVREGKCQLPGATKLPTIVYITDRNSKLPLVVYAKKGGRIDFSGNEKDPLEWSVSGDKINEELTAWRSQNLKLLKGNDPDSINVAIEKFVKSNEGNPVATILMLSYFNKSIDERGYADLMASLKGEARDKEWLRLMARSDQPFHSYAYPAKLRSLVMRSLNEGGDTICINGKNPVFLLFWQTGNSDRNSLIDSIKVLKKDYPDSVRIIADICLDVDSTGWRNAIRKDSLGDSKRLWAPASLVDKDVMKLAVKDIPFFIVFDSLGNQSYRGSELSEAMTRYRLLVEGKDSLPMTLR
ncbi:MAG: hypothetical protein J1F38_08970 [Muribaculaceae bacterium]|nr:hypothetical protein [Muribaculaceae bacterium]